MHVAALGSEAIRANVQTRCNWIEVGWLPGVRNHFGRALHTLIMQRCQATGPTAKPIGRSETNVPRAIGAVTYAYVLRWSGIKAKAYIDGVESR